MLSSAEEKQIDVKAAVDGDANQNNQLGGVSNDEERKQQENCCNFFFFLKSC